MDKKHWAVPEHSYVVLCLQPVPPQEGAKVPLMGMDTEL